MGIVTLEERKAREARRRRAAAEAVMAALASHARASGGGRFIVFGSAASGAMRHDSDFDVIVDFPPEGEAAAWAAVEEACRAHALAADIKAASTTAPAFLEKVLRKPVRIVGEIRDY